MCTTCNTEKSQDRFYYRKDNEKYRSQCKHCYRNKILQRPPRGKKMPCECGCQNLVFDLDSRGRPRRFLKGHFKVQQSFLEQIPTPIIAQPSTPTLKNRERQLTIPCSMRAYANLWASPNQESWKSAGRANNQTRWFQLFRWAKYVTRFTNSEDQSISWGILYVSIKSYSLDDF